MAKVIVTCGNVAVEAENQKELFELLASYQEVFSITTCKGCSKNNLRYRVREQEDAKKKTHRYFELQCQDCFAKLSFGQHVDQPTLFPKKWSRWNREANAEVEL